MEITFKTKNRKQLEASKYWIDSTTEQILFGGSKAGGKSFLGATLIFADALIYPGTHYFIARQELNDLVKFTIPTIHEVFQKWGIKLEDYGTYNGQDKAFYLNNGSKVFLLACKEIPSDPLYERFGSMQMTRGWIEEGGEVAESAKHNLWLSIGRWKNGEYGLKKKLFITANPKKNWMKREFIDPVDLPITHKFIRSLPTDNPYLPTDYVESLKNDPDTIRRQRLWEGNWDYDDDQNSLINSDALSDAFSNTIDNNGERYLIVDVARLGKDRTVFSFWEGLELKAIKTFTEQAINNTIQQIKDYASRERIPYSHILIDEDGVGGGVVDHLVGVKGFIANTSPFPTRSQMFEKQNKLDHYLVPKTSFSNLKAQCGWKLAELINNHQIAFTVSDYREIIIEELTSILQDKEVDSEGKKRLRPKDDVKQELGHSPDVGDTILMRMYFELVADAVDIDDVTLSKVNEEREILFIRNKNNRQVNSAK